MSDGFIDPGAARYRGNDPEAAAAFREIQRSLERLRIDPVFIIQSLATTVGQYWGISLGGRTSINGTDSPQINFGMGGANGSNQTHLMQNIRESPTNAAHSLPIGSMIVGSRRMGIDGNDKIFFMFATSTASIRTGGGGGGGGGGDGTGQGGGGGTNDTGGIIIIPGGGSGGGGPDGMCPYIKTATISGTGTALDGSWACTWGGSSWDSAPIEGFGTLHVQGSSGDWFVVTDSWAWENTAATHCPPNGSYTFTAGADPSATATVS